MDLTFTLEPDPHEFRRRILPFLEEDPVVRTLPITVLDAVSAGLYPEWVLAAVESADGKVSGCAVQTPPLNVIVAARTAEDVRALARGLQAGGSMFPGVVGLTPWVHEFAAAWCDAFTCTALDDRATRLFRLDAVMPPRPAPGSARVATPSDLDLLLDWTHAFGREVALPGWSDARAALTVRIAEGRAWLWATRDEVVSYAGHSPVLLGHARIGPVYTPPEHRGTGFASNLVARVSARLLELHAVPTLFTDLANPTSNAIYQAIGYTPVADAYEIQFVATDATA